MLASSKVEPFNDKDRWVIFSDLHMGDGGSNDDFNPNARMFSSILSDYYLGNAYGLILNGDVEELLRFPLSKIRKKWLSVYELFDAFRDHTRFIKTVGNHDLQLSVDESLQQEYDVRQALRFGRGGDFLNIFHGHQASKSFQEQSQFIGFTLKYFANPLGIKNYSVAHDSNKQYKIEKRIYAYSSFNKCVTVIGHTHRPLFESMHKVERIKFRIEQLCREYASSEPSQTIKESIRALRGELKSYAKKRINGPFERYIYNELFHIPCLFNSGCVIGKRGMTCLEISDGKIRLVHWFNTNISEKYLHQGGYESEKLGNSDFYRMVINEESLDYIFTRIKFLT